MKIKIIEKKCKIFKKIVDKYSNTNNKKYFSIFDGYGKIVIEPIKYTLLRLPNIFSNFLMSTRYNIEKKVSFIIFKKLLMN